MTDRSFRSLSALNGASTSRVLNLLFVQTQNAGLQGFQNKPFFSAPRLNSAIIVKHRLRSDDISVMVSPKAVSTKIIVPFDRSDLKAGGQSLLVGQRGYQELLKELGQYAGGHDFEGDLRTLQLLDEIPSLDPFLLREKLRAHKIYPDSGYFSISAADQQRMFNYTSRELDRLTGLAGGSQSATSRMVAALLSSDSDEKLEPLRETLRLEPDDFRDGVFSWRGFIYYKWCLSEFWPDLVKCLTHMKSIQPAGKVTSDQKTFLTNAKNNIITGVRDNNQRVKALLEIYDSAYESLLSGRDANEFRTFLQRAPLLFLDIGEKMAALSHITSFWRYRFPKDVRAVPDAEELIAILQDFSKGFAGPELKAA